MLQTLAKTLAALVVLAISALSSGAYAGPEVIFPLLQHCEDCPVPFVLAANQECRDCPFPMALGGQPKTLTESGNKEMAAPQPATRIVQAEAMRLNIPLSPLLIVAVGQFAGTSWSHAYLEPVEYIVEPADGIYDLTLVAVREPGPKNFGLSYQTAVSIWRKPEKVKGIRIRSETNAIEVRIPAPQAEQPATKTTSTDVDYKNWIGKRFVRTGEQYSGQDAIKEEQLQKPYRIFTPDASIGDRMYNPRRINVHLDKQNIIVAVSIG